MLYKQKQTMKTITIKNNGAPVSMFKVKASKEVAIIQAEQKIKTIAATRKLNINNLTYSIS